MDDLKFADFLRSSREKADLTQKQVADQLGYKTSQFVSNWERGHSIPPMNALKTLSKMYKLSLNELFEQVLGASLAMSEELMRTQYSQLKKRK